MPRNDDISLILAKAKINGFFEDVKDYELDALSGQAKLLFKKDSVLFGMFNQRTDARTIVIGDSTDALGSGYWFNRLTIRSNQKVTYLRNAGVSGNTTTQMLARLGTDVIAYSPSICIIGGPTNDHSQGIPELTTRSNFEAMYNALSEAGIKVVVRNCWPNDTAGSSPPWNTVALRRAAIQRHNSWLQEWAGSKGIPVLDVYTPTVDPATGGFRSAIAGDGTHPTEQGHDDAVTSIINNLPPVFNGSVQLASAINEDHNLLVGKNGVFIGDSNADGVADNWQQINVLGATLTAAVSPAVGNVQHVGGTAGQVYQDAATPAAQANKNVQISGRIKMIGGQLNLRMSGGIDLGPFSVPIEGIFHFENVQGSNPTQIRFQAFAPSAQTANFDISQVLMSGSVI